LGRNDVPELLVFEAEHIGAAWSGKGRFTNGRLSLCTPGEKDVGFPYDDAVFPWRGMQAVAPALFARFSWNAFLVANNMLAEWVDRGREHPTHGLWAEYLAWVFDRAGQKVVKATVTAVRHNGPAWQVSFLEGSHERDAIADGVMLTGTGRPRSVPVTPEVPKDHVLDAESFWQAAGSLSRLKPDSAIAVVGDGGAAATILAWLAQHFEGRRVALQSISPMGTLFPRGDGYSERRWFSDPSDWRSLSSDHRRKLLGRTEAGVVSTRVKQLIDRSPDVEHLAGKAVEITAVGGELHVKIEYPDKNLTLATNYVVIAIGFDAWSLLQLVDHSAVPPLLAPGGKLLRREVEAEMLADLTLPPVSGLPKGLHVPALAGLAQGPGMGNLGSLGLMASATVSRYLRK